ncbi:MDR family NADP-dependent oxidoreductase [Halomonas elongata]|uniref:NADP-dependent oxidoreductase n=1 Tax=Halomonas elongata (strain ATCC 33173 / DSM 2581 / NBRC 15536 / NCIMB 2198 / 1H9) TaxID=768066 RepID=A0ABZ0T6Y8_HALED|nr:NADP-dependent oxidoreductase [Halomonas elongata]WBF18502.1 NADP-dependent oxidoreductase [Halomonas elongata]WPU47355.1 NADP-dependent oxidoreductase [Halomonas elongata DSM 2581]
MTTCRGTTVRAWHLARTPRGCPEPEDFVCHSIPLNPPAPGEAWLEPHWLSVDPYMRTRMQPAGYDYLTHWRPGDALSAWGLARVIASRGPWREGDWVVGHMPVAERCRLGPGESPRLPPLALPAETPTPERWLHARGMTGFTAWLAMRLYGLPRAGETVLVSAGAGAVGSLAIQWAQRAGARVVATAGDPARRDWLTERLGVAAALDHHDSDIASRLAEAVPEGIDLSIENVGGSVFEAAIDVLVPGGRVVLCGLVGQYNSPEPRRSPRNLSRLTAVGGHLQPFVVPGHESDYWARFQQDMAEWDAVAAPLDVVDGFDDWPRAFCGLFGDAGVRGVGKRVVRLR